MTGISVLKSINKLLNDSIELKNKVDNKMYPLIANETTTFPFIVYRKSSMSFEYCKDGSVGDYLQVDVIVAAKKYENSIEIAELIRETVDKKKIDKIYSIRLNSVVEDYIDDAYIQQLTFDVKIEN